MANRNYKTPHVDPHWRDSRETHPAVAMAIHAIADSSRTPEMIWDQPREAEWDHINMAVAEYIEHGDFEREPNGEYAWGTAYVTLS